MSFINNVDDFCSLQKFSGVISIFRENEVIFNNGFGLRDRSNTLKNNVETIFGIASGTKTFTAIGIIKLIEEGIIDYSTTMDEIFDEALSFCHPKATIKQLLNHTSGIYDYYDEEIITDFDNYEVSIPWFKLETPNDYYPLFESQKYKFKPGIKFSYSNGGYIFLGLIIEKLSKMKFRDFIQKKILQPVGMSSSGFYAFNNLPENVAVGYIEDEGRYLSNIYKLPIRGASDGGMYTNTKDLQLFWTSLFLNKIISKENLKQLIQSDIENPMQSGYGLGIYTSIFNDEKCYSSKGCDAGVGFNSAYIPSKKIIINILSNMTEGDDGIIEYIESELKSNGI